MSQIETSQNLANAIADLKHCGDSLNYQTKSKTKGLLDIPLLNTQIHGTQFVKYNCVQDFSNFTPMYLYPSKKVSEKLFNQQTLTFGNIAFKYNIIYR